MKQSFIITGAGHSVGSKIVENKEVALSLGLPEKWFEDHTGIICRRICDSEENVTTLACSAIEKACHNANLRLEEIGHETILLHIQNGFTHLTPPPGILICNELGLYKCRTLTIDGVCAEPINALEIGSLMLNNGSCQRVIISASVDLMTAIDPKDKNTIGLFGCGAGVLIIEKPSTSSCDTGLQGLYWDTRSEYSNLGTIPVLGYNKLQDRFQFDFGYYDMKGTDLARAAIKVVPNTVQSALDQANWNRSDIDIFILHQPNVKLIELAAHKLKLDREKVFVPVHKLGNMGPASLLVAFSMALAENRIRRGSKVFFISFGLGFSCGAAAVIY